VAAVMVSASVRQKPSK